MRTITFKRQMIFILLMLFCGISINAADDLITQQITIKLDSAGTLPNRIGSSKKYKITNLKIIGDINGTDLRFIREMAGRDCNYYSTDGKLTTLDLGEAKIVKGGDYYNKYSASLYYTDNDEIGPYAFYGCRGLTSLTFPSSVTSIGKYAFNGCSGLTSLTIPSSVTSIGHNAFGGCKLKEVLYYIDEDLGEYLQKGHPYIASANYKYFLNNQEITNLTIPSNVTSIGQYAFYGCSGLTSLTIPSSVTSIGDNAFGGCKLKEVLYYIDEDLGEYLQKGHPYIASANYKYFLNNP